MVDPPNLIPYVTFGYIISRWVSCISARGNLLSKIFQRGWTSLAVKVFASISASPWRHCRVTRLTRARIRCNCIFSIECALRRSVTGCTCISGNGRCSSVSCYRNMRGRHYHVIRQNAVIGWKYFSSWIFSNMFDVAEMVFEIISELFQQLKYFCFVWNRTVKYLPDIFKIILFRTHNRIISV